MSPRTEEGIKSPDKNDWNPLPREQPTHVNLIISYSTKHASHVCPQLSVSQCTPYAQSQRCNNTAVALRFNMHLVSMIFGSFLLTFSVVKPKLKQKQEYSSVVINPQWDRLKGLVCHYAERQNLCIKYLSCSWVNSLCHRWLTLTQHLWKKNKSYLLLVSKYCASISWQ